LTCPECGKTALLQREDQGTSIKASNYAHVDGSPCSAHEQVKCDACGIPFSPATMFRMIAAARPKPVDPQEERTDRQPRDPTAVTETVREYQCRHCGYFLFETALVAGRLDGVPCTNRRCGKRQTVHLGPGSVHLRPAPREQDAYSASAR
jgi:hypothetical protein